MVVNRHEEREKMHGCPQWRTRLRNSRLLGKKNQGYDVHAITFRYGQIATKEVEYAARIAVKLGVPIKVVGLSSLKEIFAGVTSLCDESIPMTSSFSQPIIVPFRNAIFLSIVVAYAVAVGATKVFYGAQGSDEPFYLDCRKEFYKSFETAAKLGTSQDIAIEAPFGNIPKSGIIRLGSELVVPLPYVVLLFEWTKTLRRVRIMHES